MTSVFVFLIKDKLGHHVSTTDMRVSIEFEVGIVDAEIDKRVEGRGVEAGGEEVTGMSLRSWMAVSRAFFLSKEV